MHRLLAVVLSIAVTACTGLPEPRLAEAPVEQSHTVAELAPGHYHVMVRGATFAPRAATETLLRERAARVCGERRALIDRLEVVDHPALASAEVSCESVAAPLPAITPGVATPATPATPVALVAPATAPPLTPRHPATTGGEANTMVASGTGLPPRPPAPGYIPPFAHLGSPRPNLGSHSDPNNGWMEALGGPPAVATSAPVTTGKVAPRPPF